MIKSCVIRKTIAKSIIARGFV